MTEQEHAHDPQVDNQPTPSEQDLGQTGITRETLAELEAGSVCELALQRVQERIATLRDLGGWPEYIDDGSLTERIPMDPTAESSGFDAGIACALGLIPEDKQRLSAILHAAYTPEAVEQVRNEMEAGLDPDSETCWWLAACSICIEGGVKQEDFKAQLENFEKLRKDPELRQEVAQEAFKEMYDSFSTGKFGSDVPYGDKDGCIQGAYLAGYEFGVSYNEHLDMYFIGTYTPSLGIPDDFEWSSEVDADGRSKSGPVHGSKQFVKCANEEEVRAVVAIVQEHLAERS